MTKALKIIFLTALISGLLAFFFLFTQKEAIISNREESKKAEKTQVALIFDDLGNSLQELHQIYELKVPVTIAVIPGLRFSKNIAHVGARAGFSVLIHLPLEAKEANIHSSDQYDFIGSHMPKNQINRLLNNYLNSIRIAIGVNNHMGSKATEDPQLMAQILRQIKRRGLLFIDSRTSQNSVAYQIAKEKGLKTAQNHAFLDVQNDINIMDEKMEKLIKENRGKKIIIIAHPKKNTFKYLQDNIGQLKEKADFITIKQYFE